jgi:hypothetical protein
LGNRPEQTYSWGAPVAVDDKTKTKNTMI